MFTLKSMHETCARPSPASPFIRKSRTVPSFAIQRKCACGGGCPSCREHEMDLQTKLSVNTPGDAFEQEADRVAHSVSNGTPAAIQRGIFPGNDSSATSQSIAESGRPLDRETRTFMESRMGSNFEDVRIHDSASASHSARSLNALAYTVGNHIVFRDGYQPSTASGRNLIAHELVHTVQQRTAGASVMRRFAHADCAAEPDGKWIDQITIDQSAPETVTVHWKNNDGTDGGTEQDQCSTGKGHCCVEPGTSSATCSESKSRQADTNCTPVARKNVIRHVRDHGGIEFWTEIDSARAIALHEYAPVDGTPLSHGCIRLNHDMAVKIFCGAIAQKTVVNIINVARPMCDHPALQAEWASDFTDAGTDPLPKDGETRAQVLETRRELQSAFGEKSHTPAEYAAMTPADIPRCKVKTPPRAKP